jgi:hypothetical protein
MKTIHKYSLEISDTVALDLPKGAKVLSVQNQNNIPCLWALVDPAKPKEKRHFRILGTGQPVGGTAGTFLGTVLLNNGHFVIHVFELD